MISLLTLTLTFVLGTSQPTPSITPVPITATVEDRDVAEGRKALIGHNYSKAFESFSRLAAKKPNSFDAHYYLGIVYFENKKSMDAIAEFKRAAEIDPKASSAQYELGKIYLDMGNLEAADKHFRWLYEHDQELALYRQDLMPASLLERYSPPSSTIVKRSDTGIASPSKKGPAYSIDEEQPLIQKMTAALRPEITYKEKARYTEIAHKNCVQGTVVLNMVFSSKGEITDVRVVRSLPDGLTRMAIEAAQKMRFRAAKEDGQPVSVRGNVEFNFTLY